MSAREKAEKAAASRQQRTNERAVNGMRNLLADPDGRALLWSIYSGNADAEGPGSRGRRTLARDIIRAAKVANWEGVQAMREEFEKPGLRVSEDEQDGEE